MRSIDDIRRHNITLLERSFGTLKSLADVLERSESQVSQWKNGAANSGTGKPRGMRSDSARYIEQKTGKPEGWMDADHSMQDPVIADDHHKTSGSAAGQALATLDTLLDKLPPLVQPAGRDALKKWAQGEASKEQTEAVLQALAEAGAKLPPLGHALTETPARNHVTKQ